MLGAVVVCAAAREGAAARWLALGISLVVAVMAIVVFVNVASDPPGPDEATSIRSTVPRS